jgi:CoA-dependent NAD(P)H sulfur oxidoreductase
MRLVVIGGIAAGMSAAARARRLDAHAEIVVLERGETVSFGACGLPYYIEGQVASLQQLVAYTADHFRLERNINVRTGAQAASILHGRRRVMLSSGEDVFYDALVIATGARPRGVELPGANQEHVFTLHTEADGHRMDEFIRRRNPRRAVVIGAGYIGLEMVEALQRRGLQVTLLEGSQDVMNRVDPEVTQRVEAELKRSGVEVQFGHRVQCIEGHNVDGIAADMVVAAVGVKPNSELAADAGVELGMSGAIRVSSQMETNVAGIFAAGDCAETTHLVTGRPAYLPLGTTANKMGRVAGANAVGRRETLEGVAGTAIVRIFDLGIGITGLSAVQARQSGYDAVVKTITAKDKPKYFSPKPVTVQLVADRATRRLLGGVVMAEEPAAVAGRVNVLATALSNRMKVADFADLDLAYAPPFATVWDPVLIAAQQLIGLLD